MTLRRLLASSWTLILLALCWLPRSNMPVEEKSGVSFLPPHFDKAVHFGLFAAFAFLWMNVGPRAGRVLLAGLALAILSELVQELPIVDRDADLLDVLADLAGVVAGTFAYVGLVRPRTDRPAD